MELDQICIRINTDQVFVGIVKPQFVLQINNMVMAVGYCQNFVSIQYL